MKERETDFSLFLAQKLYIIEALCMKNLDNELAKKIISITSASPSTLKEKYYNK